MIEAALWTAAGSSALVIGAVIGVWFAVPIKLIGLIMGFGAGALVSALAFELTGEAFRASGTGAVSIGLAAGALVFYAGGRLIRRYGGGHRTDCTGAQAQGQAAVITFGVLLDAVPEALVIGLNQLRGGGAGAAFVAAVFLANLPEALGAATGMKSAGHSRRAILGLWLGVLAASVVVAVVGYAVLDGASVDAIAVLQAFAAGAILALLADTLMPKAMEHGGNAAALTTVFGFAVSFWLTTME